MTYKELQKTVRLETKLSFLYHKYEGYKFNPFQGQISKFFTQKLKKEFTICTDPFFLLSLYVQTCTQVSALAGALAHYGVRKGDRVLIYMPLIPETIMAMLATVRLGAIHSVVFGGKI